MLRYATSADRATIIEVMQAAPECRASSYRYDDMDGLCVLDIDDATGETRGFVTFTLGKPETWIRQMAVVPKFRKRSVVANLSLAVIAEATSFGSQGVEGFKWLGYDKQWIALSKRRGAVVDKGVRVRWPLHSKAVVGWATRMQAHLDRKRTPASELKEMGCRIAVM